MIEVRAIPNATQLSNLSLKLDGIAKRAATAKVNAVAAHAGRNAVEASIWMDALHLPSPQAYPRAYRAGGIPILDKQRIVNSIAYSSNKSGGRVGTAVPYARRVQKGGTVVPKGHPWLLLPLNPPLSPKECQTWPVGRMAIRAKYPGSFFLGLDTTSAPGIYRRSSGGRLERIAAARHSTYIPPREWLVWARPIVNAVLQRVSAFVFRGVPADAPSARGGTWDRR